MGRTDKVRSIKRKNYDEGIWLWHNRNTWAFKLVEVVVLGQVLRLNVPAEQEEILRQAARNLDLQVSEMKERTGLLQLDRVLSIVALNLSFELTQEKNKNAQIENVLCTRIQQLDHSLENALGGRTIVD